MNWKELSTFNPDNFSRVNVTLKPKHHYHVQNNGNYVRVLDSEGNIIRNGGGSFYTGEGSDFVLEATVIDHIQINHGTEPMPFAKPSYDYKPAIIHVDVPTDAISKTNLTLQQFGQLVNSITGVGIGAEVMLEGTFSFSNDYFNPEQSENGFADDEQTTGGTLGFIFDPSDSRPLPL